MDAVNWMRHQKINHVLQDDNGMDGERDRDEEEERDRRHHVTQLLLLVRYEERER